MKPRLSSSLVATCALGLLALGAHAASAPSVVTQPADNLTTNQATLHGTSNPNKKTAWVYFQYRDAAASYYIQATAPQKLGSGGQPVTVVAAVTGLSRDTEYVFRLVATNNLGTTLGNELHFRTLPQPPIATTQPATEITSVSATLNGTVNPNASVPATAFFQWGTTTNYGNTTPVQTVAGGTNVVGISASIAGLSPESSYHFRLVATNAGGTTLGADQSLETLSLSVVTSCDEAHLRAAMQAGGTVTFACDGIIVLSNTLRIAKDTILDASGHSVTISGNNAVRLFEVPAGSSLTLTNLTLANGRSTNGGAIFNEGSLSAISCTFASNVAVGVDGVRWVTPNSDGRGGAVSSSGTAEFHGCVFRNNSAFGGNGAEYTEDKGGSHSGAAGKGGAICSSGLLNVSTSTFTVNAAAGGLGGPQGGSFSAGGGGFGAGGAIYSDHIAAIVACLFTGNTATGGKGGFLDGIGGYSSPGGGRGGAIFSAGLSGFTNCTIFQNVARGGSVSGSTFGRASGGAVADGAGNTVLSFCTVVQNSAISGPNAPYSGDRYGGGGLFATSGTALSLNSSIIASNTSNGSSDANVLGTVLDLGHNICSDGSANFTNASSLNAADSQLGPLQDNGGPTLTMALRPTSQAIGRGDTANSPATDQRGVARPQNGSSDSGATEFVGLPPRVFRLASASYTVVEGQPEATVTVTCAGPLDGLVSVQCATVDGTAKASLDYVATNLVLSFASGETSKTFNVQIVDDDLLEENETLQLVLSNPTGSSALDSPSNAVLTIIDKTMSSVVCSGAQLLAAASQGGEVLFGCSGTFVLTNTIIVTNALTIDGRLRTVTISGNNAVRLFKIQDGGSLTLRNLTLTLGSATNGGAIYNNGGTVEIELCRFATNRATGLGVTYDGPPYFDAHPARMGSGGAIHNERGTVRIRATSFHGNECRGGNGVYGSYVAAKPGMGGAIFNAGILSLSEATLVANSATGGTGGDSYDRNGDAFGGAICNFGELAVTNGTISANSVTGAIWFYGRLNGWGGGIFNGGGTALVQNATIANNLVVGTARGCNLAVTNGSIQLCNTIIAGALDKTNCYGILVDLGHNISSDGSCGFTNVGSLNNTNPSLAPLADNGGPTLTMALLPASPAINAADNATAPLSDQRGLPRPFGAASDIGAYEYNSPLLPLAITGWFATNQITALGKTTLQLSLTNPNPFLVSNVFLTVALPSTVVVATPANLVNPSEGIITALSGATQLTGTGIVLAANESATISVDVTSASAGAWSNGSLSLANSSLGTTTSPITPALQVQLSPWFATITECEDVRLRLALAVGGLLTFACDGTIVLTNSLTVITNTTLDAGGHAVTISGSNTFRLFSVAPGVSLTLINLTLADGLSTNGGAIYNNGGSVFGSGCVFRSNSVVGLNGLNGTNGHTGNSTHLNGFPGGDGTGGFDGIGGAILNLGELQLSNCVFLANRAEGGGGGNGGAGGVAPLVYNTGGDGGYPGAAGSGLGAAIFNGSQLRVEACRFQSNSAAGGKGGEGGRGGAGGGTGSSRAGSQGGFASGADIFNTGEITLERSSLIAGSAIGGLGGLGGDSGIFSRAACGPGGDTMGAGIHNRGGTVAVTNCTISLAIARGGVGGSKLNLQSGAGGGGYGAGIFNTNGTAYCVNLTIAENGAFGGAGGGSPFVNGAGHGGALANTNGTLFCLNTILANSSGGNCFGIISDGGHNLCSDNSTSFTAPGSLNNTDPKLGPLADNGGPTLTMALLPGSPAIDAGVVVAGITTDQRGFARPFGPAPDIGAFEFGAALPPQPFRLTTPIPANGNWQLQLSGPTGLVVRLQESSDLLNWADIATNSIGGQGFLLLPLPSTTAPQHFYRTVSP